MDVREMAVEQLMREVAVVFQDTFLFDGLAGTRRGGWHAACLPWLAERGVALVSCGRARGVAVGLRVAVPTFRPAALARCYGSPVNPIAIF